MHVQTIRRAGTIAAAAAVLAAIVASCVTSPKPDPAPAVLLEASYRVGASATDLIALADRINGDDDMPRKAHAGDDDQPTSYRECGLAGAPAPTPIGCNPDGRCITRWTNACGTVFYEVGSPEGGPSDWYGPQGCPRCSPF